MGSSGLTKRYDIGEVKKQAVKRHAAEMAKVERWWQELRRSVDPANKGGFVWQDVEYNCRGEVWGRTVKRSRQKSRKAASKPKL